MGICDGRIAIVTGAGRGLGRAHSLLLAQEGARVVGNDPGANVDGNPGQTNYGAAKAGIAAFTVIAAQELGHYGVTVNAVAPGARTRMTENLGVGRPAAERKPEAFDDRAPENVSPLVVWLASAESFDVTGRVFNMSGGNLSVAEGWRRGPGIDKGDRWEPAELGKVVPDLAAQAQPAFRDR